MRYTITEALAAMRRLERADTGRLQGIAIRYDIDRHTGDGAAFSPMRRRRHRPVHRRGPAGRPERNIFVTGDHR
jgi:hypothetical protein